MKKLKSEQIAPYLPYKLKCKSIAKKISKTEYKNKIFELTEIKFSKSAIFRFWTLDEKFVNQIGCSGIGFRSNSFKPILKPLSDYQDINSPAMSDLNCDIYDQIQISELANGGNVNNLPYGSALICFRNHIDIFGLITDGLAINENTLTKTK